MLLVCRSSDERINVLETLFTPSAGKSTHTSSTRHFWWRLNNKNSPQIRVYEPGLSIHVLVCFLFSSLSSCPSTNPSDWFLLKLILNYFHYRSSRVTFQLLVWYVPLFPSCGCPSPVLSSSSHPWLIYFSITGCCFLCFCGEIVAFIILFLFLTLSPSFISVISVSFLLPHTCSHRSPYHTTTTTPTPRSTTPLWSPRHCDPYTRRSSPSWILLNPHLSLLLGFSAALSLPIHPSVDCPFLSSTLVFKSFRDWPFHYHSSTSRLRLFIITW